MIRSIDSTGTQPRVRVANDTYAQRPDWRMTSHSDPGGASITSGEVRAAAL
jgi:hypothetical protein